MDVYILVNQLLLKVIVFFVLFNFGDCIEFTEADAITRPNRYLLIATSGGLNQQRTGVILIYFLGDRASWFSCYYW